MDRTEFRALADGKTADELRAALTAHFATPEGQADMVSVPPRSVAETVEALMEEAQ